MIGIMYSLERNVGKSLGLEILAKAQGIVQGIGSDAHPLHCSGGDQTISRI